MELERNLLLKEIKRLLRFATTKQLDLVCHFLRGMIK